MELTTVSKVPSEAMFIIDEDKHVINCNQTAENIFGWSVDCIIGSSFTEKFIPRSEKDQFENILKSIFNPSVNGFRINAVEQNVMHREGHEFPVEINICPIQKQSASAFVLTARDISKRIRHVQTLQQVSENQQIVNAILKIALGDYSLEEILYNALDAVLSLTTPKLLNKGAVLLVDDAADYLVLKAHKGFSEQQLKTCSRVPFGTCHCGRAALTGDIQFSECVDEQHDIRLDNMQPHGHYCVPICSGAQILGVMSLYLQEGHAQNDEEKEVLRAVTNILAGVIERKKAEIQRYLLIKKQEAMITRIFDEKKLNESIIQSLNAGLMVFDLGGSIVTINQSGKKILSLFVDKDEGGSFTNEQFATFPVVRQMLEIDVDCPNSNDKVIAISLWGEERTLQHTVVTWENSSGRQIGFILLFRDITDTLRIQREMENMNRLSTVAEIASAVAHEVRNPLAGIKTMSQAIEENCGEDDENREYITRIIKQVDRLNDLLTEFFTYARPGEAKKEKVSMAYIINEIRQLLKVKLDCKRILLEENYAESLPDIHVDPDQMQQVFLNLMLNAIDAMNSNGKIEIIAKRADQETIRKYSERYPELKEDVEYVDVCFKDDGKGMSPDVAEKAFEPFYTTKSTGSGLGLAIVHRILKENNAFITADATQPRGMTFQMMFESVH